MFDLKGIQYSSSLSVSFSNDMKLGKYIEFWGPRKHRKNSSIFERKRLSKIMCYDSNLKCAFTDEEINKKKPDYKKLRKPFKK